MKKLILLLILISALLPSCIRAENKYISQSFTFTEEELDTTLSNLPEKVIENIKSDRKGFLDKIIPLIDIYDDFLVLADKNNPLSEKTIPGDLVDLDSFNIKVNKKGMQIRKPAMDALMMMKNDAEKENLDILVSSAYRSYTYQERIYNYYVSVYGQEETDKFSARPGTSQHQLGTAVDFGSITEEYENTPEGIWMFENCGRYGFSLSYPKGLNDVTGYNYEPWHYRFITAEGCDIQKSYFEDVQQYLLEYLDENISILREKRIMQDNKN